MPTYLFYPHRADGVSLTFIAEAARSDKEALILASEIAAAHDCSGVFIWEPATEQRYDRFVGEVRRQDDLAPHRTEQSGASLET